MKNEIQRAVNFIASLMRGMSSDQLHAFKRSLSEVLLSHYRDHWFPDKPCRGSAYRCIRVNQKRIDPLVAAAGFTAGLPDAVLLQHLPSELTIWVDPNEVSYRFGEDGSIGVVLGEQESTSVLEPASRIQGLYDTCRQQVHDLFQSAASLGSDRLGSDCLRSFIMV